MQASTVGTCHTSHVGFSLARCARYAAAEHTSSDSASHRPFGAFFGHCRHRITCCFDAPPGHVDGAEVGGGDEPAVVDPRNGPPPPLVQRSGEGARKSVTSKGVLGGRPVPRARNSRGVTSRHKSVRIRIDHVLVVPVSTAETSTARCEIVGGTAYWPVGTCRMTHAALGDARYVTSIAARLAVVNVTIAALFGRSLPCGSVVQSGFSSQPLAVVVGGGTQTNVKVPSTWVLKGPQICEPCSPTETKDGCDSAGAPGGGGGHAARNPAAVTRPTTRVALTVVGGNRPSSKRLGPEGVSPKRLSCAYLRRSRSTSNASAALRSTRRDADRRVRPGFSCPQDRRASKHRTCAR